jgi:flotillin
MVEAEAEAEKRRIEAEGEAKAIYARLEAEARGQYEILAKKGEGLGRIVEACGSAEAAFQMLMLEHIEALSANAAQAIQNIKFDKIVVWDGGGAAGGAGGGPGATQGATAGFLRNLAGSLPPMLHMMRDIGGVKMPDYFGKLVPGEGEPGATPPAGAAPGAPGGASTPST